MDKEAIKNILPHREPMLLIDETELVDGIAISRYTVRGDEFFLRGHFPGNPVVPGVILCEMMAQSACLLVNSGIGKFTPYFTGIKNVKFKNKVAPGDTVTFKSQTTAQKGAFYFIRSDGYVGDKLCVRGELSFAVIQEE
ncbi:MAG: beta-hydroxyacyl-ACP dehydratase [Oscillospiraceae bacterium]|nr:beta-hydroxyacyl-ACP dehydratase [Oscillospiraceae bacterium]